MSISGGRNLSWVGTHIASGVSTEAEASVRVATTIMKVHVHVPIR